MLGFAAHNVPEGLALLLTTTRVRAAWELCREANVILREKSHNEPPTYRMSPSLTLPSWLSLNTAHSCPSTRTGGSSLLNANQLQSEAESLAKGAGF